MTLFLAVTIILLLSLVPVPVLATSTVEPVQPKNYLLIVQVQTYPGNVLLGDIYIEILQHGKVVVSGYTDWNYGHVAFYLPKGVYNAKICLPDPYLPRGDRPLNYGGFYLHTNLWLLVFALDKPIIIVREAGLNNL